MLRTYTLVLFLILVAFRAEAVVYDIHVDAFPDPERVITRALPVCFDMAISKIKDQSLEAKNTATEILEVCEKVAKLKGLTIMSPTRGRDCLHVGFEWDIAEAERSTTNSSKSCFRFYNGMFCNRRGNETMFGKGIKMAFYDNGFAPPRRVLELQAAMTSEQPGFRRNSAEVLCRAAFQDYPRKLKDKFYHVEPSLE